MRVWLLAALLVLTRCSAFGASSDAAKPAADAGTTSQDSGSSGDDDEPTDGGELADGSLDPFVCKAAILCDTFAGTTPESFWAGTGLTPKLADLPGAGRRGLDVPFDSRTSGSALTGLTKDYLSTLGKGSWVTDVWIDSIAMQLDGDPANSPAATVALFHIKLPSNGAIELRLGNDGALTTKADIPSASYVMTSTGASLTLKKWARVTFNYDFGPGTIRVLVDGDKKPSLAIINIPFVKPPYNLVAQIGADAQHKGQGEIFFSNTILVEP
jgi:hypothetical protein